MNHLGHSNSYKRAFIYYPLGTFKMDLSPNFILVYQIFVSRDWATQRRPLNKLCVLGRAKLKKKNAALVTPPLFIVPMELFA